MTPQPVITHLHFKNWRSLRDVTIDNLTPLTVFVSANSSGKTNILDALRFLRQSVTQGIESAVLNWGGRHKIRRVGASDADIVELEISFDVKVLGYAITDVRRLKFEKERDIPFFYSRKLLKGTEIIFDDAFQKIPDEIFNVDSVDDPDRVIRADNITGVRNRFYRERIQFLGENFISPLTSSGNENDPYVINSDADNVPAMLNLLKQTATSDQYANFEADLAWLLDHVNSLTTDYSNEKIQMRLYEKIRPDQEAPNISAGTKRVIPMLVANYILNVRNANLPGLVVIEEPDTAIHPLLLENLVELFRQYVNGEYPRQIILTTHNPMFLNYFKPEEVQIVERDPETGETKVNAVDKDVVDVWHKKYGDYSVGDVWTTRLLGGVPE